MQSNYSFVKNVNFSCHSESVDLSIIELLKSKQFSSLGRHRDWKG